MRIDFWTCILCLLPHNVSCEGTFKLVFYMTWHYLHADMQCAVIEWEWEWESCIRRVQRSTACSAGALNRVVPLTNHELGFLLLWWCELLPCGKPLGCASYGKYHSITFYHRYQSTTDPSGSSRTSTGSPVSYRGHRAAGTVAVHIVLFLLIYLWPPR